MAYYLICRFPYLNQIVLDYRLMCLQKPNIHCVKKDFKENIWGKASIKYLNIRYIQAIEVIVSKYVIQAMLNSLWLVYTSLEIYKIV